MKRSTGLLLAAALAAGRAPAEPPPPTPPAQSVVVPALPDQKNKETTTRPSGTLAVDSAGWVRNGPEPAPRLPATPAAERPGPSAPGAGPPPLLPPGPAPSAPAVIGAAHVTLRGVVTSFRKGVSVTIRDAGGRTRTVPLAERAEVYEGLKPGDPVALRIPLGKPADGKSADRIEKEKPKSAPPKSKFAAAQSGAD